MLELNYFAIYYNYYIRRWDYLITLIALSTKKSNTPTNKTELSVEISIERFGFFNFYL